MKNNKSFGIKFRRSYDSGIAKIVVFDITTSKYVNSEGIEQTDFCYRTVDLYLSTNNIASEYDFVYWITLIEGNNYNILISPTGLKNTLSSGYKLNIMEYLTENPMQDSVITPTITTWHSTYPTETTTTTVTPETMTSFDKTCPFLVTSTGGENLFILYGSHRAAEFIGVSLDNGASWISPHSITLTWGSNYVDCDDETIDSSGYFGVKFVYVLPVGTTVLIKFKPLTNKLSITHNLLQPTNADLSFTDLRSETNLLGYSLEIIG